MSRKKEDIRPECGLRLKSLLASSGITQKEMAKRLGYSEQHISLVIRGKRRLPGEMAERIIKELFPECRYQWLMCIDDFMTEDERREHSKKIWEENQKLEDFYNKVFRLFIEGIEDINGCGISLSGIETDILGHKAIIVSDAEGKEIGTIPMESFDEMRKSIENYASYLIHCLIKNKMEPPKRKGRESVESWQTFKNAVTSPAN